MKVLEPFAPWPRIKNPKFLTDPNEPEHIDEGIVTLVNNGINAFVKHSGCAPTNIVLGPNAALKFRQLPAPYYNPTYETKFFGLEVLFALDNGIWLFRST